MDINLIKLVIDITPECYPEFIPLVTGKGAVFDNALRQVCCNQGNLSCLDCSSRHHCTAHIMTAQELSKDPELVRRHQKPGRPYIFKNIYLQNTRLPVIGLTLLGPACSHLSTVLTAIAHLAGGKRGIRSISALDYQDTPVQCDLTYFNDISTLPVLSSQVLIALHSHCFTNCTHARLLLKTPLRIVKDMRELNRFDPVTFCQSVVRRISSLTAYYGDVIDDSDLFRFMSERCREVQLARVFDYATGINGTLRGVTGCYELIGPFGELGPMLYLGSLFHVGKRASYGLGAFDIMSFGGREAGKKSGCSKDEVSE